MTPGPSAATPKGVDTTLPLGAREGSIVTDGTGDLLIYIYSYSML